MVTSELFFEVVEHAVAAAAIGDLVIGGGGLATASSTLAATATDAGTGSLSCK